MFGSIILHNLKWIRVFVYFSIQQPQRKKSHVSRGLDSTVESIEDISSDDDDFDLTSPYSKGNIQL